MTTHYEKIQALGNRMASNLETMGVSASFSDGGLTLADKILQIQRFNSGLMVYADKDIAQSGNTVNISALLMKNGKAVSGERVILKGLNSEVTVGSTDVSINTDYMITLNTEATFNIRDSNNVYVIFMYYSNSWQIKIGSGSSTPIGDGVVFIESGAVKYYDSNNVLQTVSDFTGAVMNSSNGANNTAYPIWVGTTGSDGVVSKSYTCSGAGLKTITAESGTLVSEPYEVLDTLFYDDGVGGNNTAWTKTNATANYDSTGTSFIPTANWGNLTLSNDDWFNKLPFVVEFEIVECSGEIRIYYDSSNHYIAFNSSGSYRLELSSDGAILKKNGTQVGTGSAPVTVTDFSIVSTSSSNSCKFKEFKIYPI